MWFKCELDLGLKVTRMIRRKVVFFCFRFWWFLTSCSRFVGNAELYLPQVDILNKVDWNAWMFTPGMPPVKPQ